MNVKERNTKEIKYLHRRIERNPTIESGTCSKVLSRNVSNPCSLKRKRCSSLIWLETRNTLQFTGEEAALAAMRIQQKNYHEEEMGRIALRHADSTAAAITAATRRKNTVSRSSNDNDAMLERCLVVQIVKHAKKKSCNSNISFDDVSLFRHVKSNGSKKKLFKMHSTVIKATAIAFRPWKYLFILIVCLSTIQAHEVLADDDKTNLPRRLQSISTSRPSTMPSMRPTRNISEEPSIHSSTTPSLQASPTPSAIPSAYPSKSQSPSMIPTMEASKHPSSRPSNTPSAFPTIRPTVSLFPTMIPSSSNIPSSKVSLTPSTRPTLAPSSVPSSVPTTQPSISNHPSWKPSAWPSVHPSNSLNPSISPSSSPSVSLAPSSIPSISQLPSQTPSLQPSSLPSYTPTKLPSQYPSFTPSISKSPSAFPSISSQPSVHPTNMPSLEPTNQLLSRSFDTYYQEFNATTNLDLTQMSSFASIIEGYTRNITTGTIPERVTALCIVEKALLISQKDQLNIEYTVTFESNYTNVLTYTTDLKDFINANLNIMEGDLKDVGIMINEATATFILEDTNSPTIVASGQPSKSPSSFPSSFPSTIPSYNPSFLPSEHPSDIPSNDPSHLPSSIPSIPPSSEPSFRPSLQPSNIPSQVLSLSPSIYVPPTGSTTIIVSVTASLGGMALLILGSLCWRRRCVKADENDDGQYIVGTTNDINNNSGRRGGASYRPSRTNGILGGGIRATHLFRGNMDTPNRRNNNNDQHMIDAFGIAHSPNGESMVSRESIISTGSSVDGGSDNEADDTQVLADEFDKYKDQNLERMRSELEGNVTNFDGMMSQAMTMTLMDDDDDDFSESVNNMIGDKDSIQIEADLLCEMNDWLKRSSNASVDDRREFMQESLNKMVSSVRYGAVSPGDASRVIHGCAALLGLQLAEDIPETTLIITGMRKSVTRKDVEEAFTKFGEIDGASVSSNQRGFGIVRFQSKKNAKRALESFEIVVQDVAVSVRLLKAKMPEIEARRDYANVGRSR